VERPMPVVVGESCPSSEAGLVLYCPTTSVRVLVVEDNQLWNRATLVGL
jgi:hypothetical protein